MSSKFTVSVPPPLMVNSATKLFKVPVVLVVKAWLPRLIVFVPPPVLMVVSMEAPARLTVSLPVLV